MTADILGVAVRLALTDTAELLPARGELGADPGVAALPGGEERLRAAGESIGNPFG